MATETGNGGGRSSVSRESQRLMGTGSRLAASWFGTQKSAIAHRLHEAALGLRSMGGSMGERPNLREYVEAAADGIDSISEEIERRDFSELAERAEEAIRRQPVMVFAGLLAAGMIITRMVRADDELGMQDDSGMRMGE